MKKLFIAVMAVAAIAFVGCNPKNPAEDNSQGNANNTTEPQDPGTDPSAEVVPDGYIDILVQVPEGEDCNGIYLKGWLNGEWSGDGTFISETSANTPVADAIKFERVEKSDFFRARFKLGTPRTDDNVVLEGVVCQKFDGSWNGKGRMVSIIEDKTTMENAAAWRAAQDNWPQFKLTATKGCVLALKIGAWMQSECVAANEAGSAKWTMKTSVALPDGTEVGITGTGLVGYGNWDHPNPIIMTKQADGSYVAINQVEAHCVYKYVLKLPGESEFQDKHGHIIGGDKGDLSMPVSREPVDVVEDWLELDKIYAGKPFEQDKYAFGLIGEAVGGWGDNDVVMTYVDKDGDFFVCQAENVVMAAGPFKVRANKNWDDCTLGWSDVTIAGDVDNFEAAASDGNISCKAGAEYKKVVLKFKWSGSRTKDATLEFVK